MVRIRRNGLRAPARWPNDVAAELPDVAAYRRKAREFERLPMGGKKRRAGFARHAPAVLPVGKKGKPEFPAVWRTRKYVKEAIAGLSNDCCAYCQIQVRGGQAGHVEHFRPKSLFPSLAYEWKNYFLACEQCNLKKGDQWPVRGAYVVPDRGDPAQRFVFEPDGGIKPRAGDAAARATCEDLGLDRASLRKARRTAIESKLKYIETIVGLVKTLGKRSRVTLDELLVPELTPFSAAINANVRRVWNENSSA